MSISTLVSQTISSMLVSTPIWMLSAFCVLSLPGILNSGSSWTMDNPISTSMKYGAAVGIFHGLLTGLLISWYRTESAIGMIFSSIASTEILIFLVMAIVLIYQLLNPVVGGARVPTPFFMYLAGLGLLLMWFLIFSALFLIPSIIIGFANRFIPVFLRKI